MIEDNAWRVNIGEIAPTVFDYGDQFRQILPEGAAVSVLTTGSPVKEYEKDDLSDAHDRRYEAALMLDSWDVDCIIAGGGPPSTVNRVEVEEQFISDLRSELSAPFTTAIKAQIDAFESLNAERILVITPFSAERNEETKDFIERNGFEVVSIGGIQLDQPRNVRSLSPATAYQQALKEYQKLTEDIDLVYVACLPFTPAKYIHHIEKDTGETVVTSLQAHIWKAFEMADLEPDISGYGKLLES